MSDLSRAGTPAVPPRRFRWGLYLPYLVLLVLAIAWCAFWFMARQRVEAALDGWLSREASQGRNWVCPNRAVSGFPMRFELVCEKPTFVGRIPQGAIEGSMERFVAAAQVYDPNLVVADLTGPLIVKSQELGQSAKLDWQAFNISLRHRDRALVRLSTVVRNPSLSLASASGQDATVAKGTLFELHVRPDPQRPADQNAYDVVSRFDKASIPSLDQIVRSAAPTSIELQAAVSQANAFVGGTGPAQMEQWRSRGGDINLVLLKVDKAAQRLEAKGTLGLDDQHRPTGQINAQVAGLNEIVGALTGRSGGFGGLIAGGLNMLGRPAQPPSGTGPAMTALPPIVLANGQVMVGPFNVARLPPLY